MIVRDAFQARYGKGDELVALFKEARQQWPLAVRYAFRILTDASGPFFTVVTETQVDSLADWEQFQAQVWSLPEFAQWFARMTALVEGGRREFYKLEG